MKNHTKPNADREGKDPHAGKDEKVPAHGHGHVHDKTDKHETPVSPVPAEAGKPAAKPQDEALVAKIANTEDRHLRLLADFDNFRKRSQREKEMSVRVARENMLVEFLPVIDNIELGINAALAHKMDKAFVDGYRMISDQLSAALARFGLKPQEAQGAQFDPNLHEAIQNVPSDEFPAGTVVTVVRKGYLSNDVVLRPAQVIVSSGPMAVESAVADAAERAKQSSGKQAPD